MQNLNDEKLFKLVEEHFGVTYYAVDDAVLHNETGHYHAAYLYRDFAQAVIDVALKDLALDAERYRWLRDEWLNNEPESINMARAKGQRGLDAAIDAAIATVKEKP